MNSKFDPLTAYLARYAEPETALCKTFPASLHFANTIVIPACNEDMAFVNRLTANPLFCSSLIILVINQPENADIETFRSNQLLHDTLSTRANTLWKNQHLALYKLHRTHFLVVDRFSQSLTIPVKEGVGRARKIGSDIAVTLYHQQHLASRVVYSTDADAHLPDNYFDSANDHSVAKIFNFYHFGGDPGILEATLLYERALHYYRDALAFAGSPYAFHTLGSTLAFDLESYCMVRGFPPRNGAEDFYLINKLAKIGGIQYNPGIRIGIEARSSHRVPFGTGPAVSRILEQIDNKAPYLYYNPEIFLHLKEFLDNKHLLHGIRHSGSLIHLLNNRLIEVLELLNIKIFFQHCHKQDFNEKQHAHQFMIWFDAFKTLKLVHLLQDLYYPAIPLDKALTQFHVFNKNHA